MFIFILSIFICPVEARAYDPQYLNEVVGRQAVSLGDGLEMIMILLKLEDKYPAFNEQMAFMKENDLIKDSLVIDAQDAPLRRGALAYMLCKTLKLKGGLKAHLLGLNERFAMDELIYQGVMRPGHKADLVSGQELVLIMTGAAQHMLARSK